MNRFIALNVLTVFFLMACEAEAHMHNMDMEQKEFVQSMSWAIELVTFFTILAVGVIVWRISKRDAKNNSRSRRNRKPD